ncbi:hypothetical protein N658DRAFT_318491 [Parathielavia hyrcaniae]|uniref:Uncharacterized protein n=1 Tax=Parathielavia hyrcaniae TaxID=113614 RepID=A0AAN6SXY5_9PEZI|nr:hypothetical protein N658DRAFT_318491 [Parathielavia hyrcaniae]
MAMGNRTHDAGFDTLGWRSALRRANPPPPWSVAGSISPSVSKRSLAHEYPSWSHGSRSAPFSCSRPNTGRDSESLSPVALRQAHNRSLALRGRARCPGPGRWQVAGEKGGWRAHGGWFRYREPPESECSTAHWRPRVPWRNVSPMALTLTEALGHPMACSK